MRLVLLLLTFASATLVAHAYIQYQGSRLVFGRGRCNNCIQSNFPSRLANYATARSASTVSVEDLRALKQVDEQTPLLSFWRIVQSAFLPSMGQSSKEYLHYMAWRAVQRLVSSTNSVFCTQALLLAVGVKSRSYGTAALSAWILKDTAGKLSRVLWASKFGKSFDADTKKWRFRSSLMFAVGNCLEIVTLCWPKSFLVCASLGNMLKQMAMLTYSSTRNAIYKSFSSHAENIGDITAKGEAQAAVIDIFGLLLGITISKWACGRKAAVVAVFSLLSIVDLACSYYEIRSVQFTSLNFERWNLIMDSLRSSVGSTDIPRCEGLNISPPAIREREQLLWRARPGSSIFQTWKSISAAGLWQFHQSMGSGHYRHVEDNFSVVFHTRRLSNWVEWMQIAVGLRSHELVRIMPDGVPVVFSAEVLLHRSATLDDIDRAVLIAKLGMWKFQDNSVECALPPLWKLFASSTSEWLQPSCALKIREEAYHLEVQQGDRLRNAVATAGWLMKSFSFGPTTRRVDWPTENV